MVFSILANFSTLDASCSNELSPVLYMSAVSLASSDTVLPLFAASEESIHGSNSLASSLGNAKHRFPMSPLGSMTMEGILSIAASSISPIPSPVLPEPVMPIIIACVVKWFDL